MVKVKKMQSGRHKGSTEKFDLASHSIHRTLPPMPRNPKQPDVMEWLEKVEFGPVGMWKAEETMKISSALTKAHKKIDEANSNRANELRDRLRKSQERVEHLRNRMALADKSLACLNQAILAAIFAVRSCIE